MVDFKLHLKCPHCQEYCDLGPDEALTKENGSKYIICANCGEEIIFCRVEGKKE